MSMIRKLASPDEADHCRTCLSRRVITGEGDRQALARRCPDCFDHCERCGGKGYFFGEDWTGSPLSTPCDCVEVDRRIRLYNGARIPRRYAAANLETGTVEVNDSVRAAKIACFKTTRGFETGDQGVGLIGPVGTGKTHLVAALVRELTLTDGVETRFVEFTHLLSELKAGYEAGGPTQDIIAHVVEVPVLVIDELGKGLTTEWQNAILDELLSKRYNSRVTTFFTSNYPIDTSEVMPRSRSRERFEVTTLESRIGSRMFSRLSEMCRFVSIDAPDFRRTHGGGET